MKGLLQYDWMQTKKYCRMMGVMAVFFLAIYGFGGELFCLFFPSVLISMVPMTLLGYDEKSGWDRYCCNLPLDLGAYVSSKYLMGLMVSLPVVLAEGLLLLLAVKQGTLTPGEAGESLMVISAVTLGAPALTLPFLFRFGMEKGRIAYYVFFGGACALFSLLTLQSQPLTQIPLLGAAILLYALSWGISIQAYKKRMGA